MMIRHSCDSENITSCTEVLNKIEQYFIIQKDKGAKDTGKDMKCYFFYLFNIFWFACILQILCPGLGVPFVFASFLCDV